MGLGGTAKKLQTVVNAAEELYAKMNEVIGQLKELQAEVERTSEQVDHIEYDVTEQRAILEAIAESQDLDVESILAEADLPPEPVDSAETEGPGEAADANGESDAPPEESASAGGEGDTAAASEN